EIAKTTGKTISRKAVLETSSASVLAELLKQYDWQLTSMTTRMIETALNDFAALSSRLTAFLEISKRIKSAA
ncbi:MAG TPA: hypothetical protein VL688_07385, partial [Verrucomicrobiae bacterium]|nr:hypothetical protein [Verrucomicrobiae bacterium]